MICEELKSRKNFVEEDFIELRDSVEELISVIEKYKDMGYNSSLYIDDLKDFLADVNLTLEEKKITDKELKNLNFLREDYFRTYGDSIYEYYVYDKNNWLKTKNTIQLKKVIKGETMLFNSLEKMYQAKVILLNNKWKELYNYDMRRIKK